MKRFILFTVSLCMAGVTASAQLQRQQDSKNPDIMRFSVVKTRSEIVIPDVNGFKALKVDLHVHTDYSDGSVMPGYNSHH